MLVLKILWLFSIILLLGSVAKCQMPSEGRDADADQLKIETEITSASEIHPDTKLEAQTTSEVVIEESVGNEPIHPENLNLEQSHVPLHSESTTENIEMPHSQADVTDSESLNEPKQIRPSKSDDINSELPQTLPGNDDKRQNSRSYKAPVENSDNLETSSSVSLTDGDGSSWSSLNLPSNGDRQVVERNTDNRNTNGNPAISDNPHEDKVLDDGLASSNLPINHEEQTKPSKHVTTGGGTTVTQDTVTTTDETVEDIFSESNPSDQTPEQKSDVVPLNDVINRWLAEQKQNSSSVGDDSESSTLSPDSERTPTLSTDRSSTLLVDQSEMHQDDPIKPISSDVNYSNNEKVVKSSTTKESDSQYEEIAVNPPNSERHVEELPVPVESGNDHQPEPLHTQKDLFSENYYHNRRRVAQVDSSKDEPSLEVPNERLALHDQGTVSLVNSPSSEFEKDELTAEGSSHVPVQIRSEVELGTEVVTEKREPHETYGLETNKERLRNNHGSRPSFVQKKAIQRTGKVNSFGENNKTDNQQRDLNHSQALQHEAVHHDTGRKLDEFRNESHLQNTGSFESQILKPTEGVVLEEKESTTYDHAGAIPVSPITTSHANTDENQEGLPNREEELLLAAKKIDNYETEDSSKSLFDSTAHSLIGDAATVQHFSRMALPDFSDSSPNTPSANAEILKKDLKDYESYFYYGDVRSNEGILYTSLNLSMKIFIDDTQLHLEPNAAVKGSYESNHAHIAFNWYHVEDRYNISAIFEIRCKSGYCFVDSIHVNTSGHLNADTTAAEEVVAQTSDLELFKTKIGTTFENDTSIGLEMEHGVAIELSCVTFSPFEDLNSTLSAQLYSYEGYYPEIIGGSVGFLLFGGAVMYAFKKWRNGRITFKPTMA